MINQDTNGLMLATNIKHKPPQASILVDCPISHQSVALKYGRSPFDIPNGQAVWWHCPICQGWHISIRD